MSRLWVPAKTKDRGPSRGRRCASHVRVRESLGGEQFAGDVLAWPRRPSRRSLSRLCRWRPGRIPAWRGRWRSSHARTQRTPAALRFKALARSSTGRQMWHVTPWSSTCSARSHSLRGFPGTHRRTDDGSMTDLDLSGAVWRKASLSGGSGGNCIEVAATCPGIVAVRDSKNPTNAALVVNPWRLAIVRGEAQGRRSVTVQPTRPVPRAACPRPASALSPVMKGVAITSSGLAGPGSSQRLDSDTV
jgi:Domain of unknown function (DUF397)